MVSRPPRSSANNRGTDSNPPNRFERLSLEPDPDAYPPDEPPPATHLYRDASQSVLSLNESPDLGFAASLNMYRGCEHGCIYCYARAFHEYLGFSAGLDFESRIMVKLDAGELLHHELAAPGWAPKTIALSGATDCYQPIERRLRLTRACLEVLARFRNPVSIVTKNRLVTRDADLLAQLASHHAATVTLSLTTLDPDLRRILEPRTSPAAARLEAIRELTAAGIPAGVLLAPIIPGLNDHEIPALLGAAAGAGAAFAGFEVLRLPAAVAPLFERWLERHLPERRDKVLNRVRSLRGGQLNDARFGTRFTGEGRLAGQIDRLFGVSCRRAGLSRDWPVLSTAAFRRIEKNQPELFD